MEFRGTPDPFVISDQQLDTRSPKLAERRAFFLLPQLQTTGRLNGSAAMLGPRLSPVQSERTQ